MKRRLISVDKLTAEQVAELAAVSLKARPTKGQRAEFALGVRCRRARKRILAAFHRDDSIPPPLLFE